MIGPRNESSQANFWGGWCKHSLPKSARRRAHVGCHVVQGNRDNIASMAPGSQKVIRQVMELIDTYDLWGSISLPKKHTQNDISDIYRLAFFTHGIFVNAALQEPFGLTVIEVTPHPREPERRLSCRLLMCAD